MGWKDMNWETIGQSFRWGLAGYVHTTSGETNQNLGVPSIVNEKDKGIWKPKKPMSDPVGKISIRLAHELR